VPVQQSDQPRNTLRNRRETTAAYSAFSEEQGTAMDRLTQRLDAIICEVAAIIWLVRAKSR
jgi:hypothetical protein